MVSVCDGVCAREGEGGGVFWSVEIVRAQRARRMAVRATLAQLLSLVELVCPF